MPIRCLRLALACVIGLAVVRAAAAAEAELAVTIAGRTTTYAPASLLGMPAAASITVPNDVAYKRDMSFRAVPAASPRHTR